MNTERIDKSLSDEIGVAYKRLKRQLPKTHTNESPTVFYKSTTNPRNNGMYALIGKNWEKVIMPEIK